MNYLENGVKARNDGKGDAWADSHRTLGRDFYMSDIDALFGTLVFGQNTAERLFMEYVPDHYTKRDAQTRDFAVVALFDRKRTREAAFDRFSKLSKDFYLWLCRLIASAQPNPPRFFYVIGGDKPPWEMIEIEIKSGKNLGERATVDGTPDGWRNAWLNLGLLGLRSELKRWIES